MFVQRLNNKRDENIIITSLHLIFYIRWLVLSQLHLAEHTLCPHYAHIIHQQAHHSINIKFQSSISTFKMPCSVLSSVAAHILFYVSWHAPETAWTSTFDNNSWHFTWRTRLVSRVVFCWLGRRTDMFMMIYVTLSWGVIYILFVNFLSRWNTRCLITHRQTDKQTDEHAHGHTHTHTSEVVNTSVNTKKYLWLPSFMGTFPHVTLHNARHIYICIYIDI